MDSARVNSMLTRIAEIRHELTDWESTLRPLPGGKDSSEAVTNGLIEMQWCLWAALGADVRFYRFRSECEADVQALLRLLPEGELVRFAALNFPPLPDTVNELGVRTLSLEDLRSLCREVADGHVMLQTIQPTEHYTGARDHSLD